MTINAGFDKEDPSIPGLAHFCEHMLFLGSKTFDKPSYFVDYITSYAGKFNGYTDVFNSAYFFELNNNGEKFKHSLEIFSKFFFESLFAEEQVEKEVNAVNSEYERNMGLDSRRKEMILRDTADRESPFSRFSTGNTDTLLNYTRLNNLSLRDAVVDFYKKHYRPDNMKLIIYGPKNIDYYEKLVKEYFDDFMQKPSEPYNHEQNIKPPWEQGKMGKIIFYETINQPQELDITILIPDIYAILPNNPAFYYKILLNYPGENSLSDYLRKEGYGGGIRVFLRRVYKGTVFLKITGFITKKGIKFIDKVIELIFQYINYIRDKALDKEQYDYIKEAYRIKFFYAHRKQSVMGAIRDLTSIMYKYPEEYYLAEHFLLSDYNEKVIKEFGNSLTVSNAIIMIGNDNFDSGITEHYEDFISDFNFLDITEKRSSYYGAKYNIFELTKKFVSNAEITKLNELYEKNIDLYPHKKPLPKIISLAIVCRGISDNVQKQNCYDTLNSDAKDHTPIQFAKTNLYEYWYKLDRSYHMAKSNLFIRFHFDFNVSDINYATKLRLLINAFNHYMRNLYFEESLRQNNIEIGPNPNGFSIKIFAFSENLKDVAYNVIQKILTMTINEDEFELIKDEMIAKIKAMFGVSPTTQAYVNFFGLILKDYIKNQEILKTLQNLKKSDFDEFFTTIFKKLYIKAFVHGTATQDQAQAALSSLNQLYSKNNSIAISQSYIDYNNKHSDLSGYFIFREQMKKEHNVNHAILNFYQIGIESVDNMFSALLIKSLVGYIYFTELRIKEQLGYTTKARVFSENNIVYYMIYIQGSTKSPDYMDYRIENVVELMRKKIEETNEKKFEQNKKTVVKNMRLADYSLKARTMR
jgi:insulysin